jgi:hypothetical protein
LLDLQIYAVESEGKMGSILYRQIVYVNLAFGWPMSRRFGLFNIHRWLLRRVEQASRKIGLAHASKATALAYSKMRSMAAANVSSGSTVGTAFTRLTIDVQL